MFFINGQITCYLIKVVWYVVISYFKDSLHIWDTVLLTYHKQ